MIEIRLFLRIFIASFSRKQLNVDYLSEFSKIGGNLLFGDAIRDFIDVDLMIGETLFQKNSVSVDIDFF